MVCPGRACAILSMAVSSLEAWISVSPHRITSHRASCTNTYCDCTVWRLQASLNTMVRIGRLCSGMVSHTKVVWLVVRTRVCTICTLFFLRPTRNAYTVTVFSAWILSSMESSRMKVPVRPTPALQCTSSGMPSSLLCTFCTLRIKEMRAVANMGTPWSGQEVKWYWVTDRGCPSGSTVYIYIYTATRKHSITATPIIST